jgi:TolB protein
VTRVVLAALVLVLAGCGSGPALIAFTSTRDGNAEVYLVRADGTGVVDLTRSLSQDGEPAWSPDGEQIAFVSTRDGNAQIYVMNADGSAQHRVTHDATSDMAPVWSPDGSRIAFMCTIPSPSIVTEICVVRADGAGERRVTSNGDNLYPHWTPQGRVIFTAPKARVAEAAYSRDGKLAFLRRTGRSFTLVADGRRLTLGPVDAFAWSPNGRELAYVQAKDIWAVDVDGRDRRQLTHGPGTSLSPQWSPDGKWIAFERTHGQHSDAYVVLAGGGGERNLTRGIGKNGGPSWQP